MPVSQAGRPRIDGQITSKGRLEIGRLLIEKGADINARDKANQLPL